MQQPDNITNFIRYYKKGNIYNRKCYQQKDFISSGRQHVFILVSFCAL